MTSPTIITQVEQQKVFVPFHQAAEWAAGKRPGTTRLIVQIHTADGTLGLGETICLWEFVEPVLARTIIPLIIGEDACDIERICKKIEGAGYYHHQRAMVAALAGVEMALWDIVGKQAGLPLYKIWGGAYRRAVPMVAYLQAKDAERIAREAASFIARGFKSIKVKIGMSEESDLAIVEAARRAVGAGPRLRADVNGAWTIGTAKRMLRRMEWCDLEYIEQPLPMDDLFGHAGLRRQTSTPIALDESAYTTQDVLNIIRHQAADVLLLDPHQAGGLHRTRKAAAIAEAAALPVTLHSGAELGISTAAYLHLAATIPNLMLAVDNQYYNQTDEIITQPHAYHDGAMCLPEAPGLGVTLDPNKLETYRIEHIREAYLDADRPTWFPTKPQY